MKLSKKHIGKMFDNHGADGSWAYLLVDARDNLLLFNVVGDSRRFEIDSNRYSDWRLFVPVLPSKREIQDAWITARKAP